MQKGSIWVLISQTGTEINFCSFCTYDYNNKRSTKNQAHISIGHCDVLVKVMTIQIFYAEFKFLLSIYYSNLILNKFMSFMLDYPKTNVNLEG